jgi:hypothetical protein
MPRMTVTDEKSFRQFPAPGGKTKTSAIVAPMPVEKPDPGVTCTEERATPDKTTFTFDVSFLLSESRSGSPTSTSTGSESPTSTSTGLESPTRTCSPTSTDGSLTLSSRQGATYTPTSGRRSSKQDGRTKYSQVQIRALDKTFLDTPYPDPEMIEHLAQDLDIPEARLKVI